MQQLGHTDPAFTLRVYTHMMRRESGEREALKALVQDADWASIGQPVVARSPLTPVERVA